MTDKTHDAGGRPQREKAKLTPDQIQARLAEYTGSENYYRHWRGGLVYTDGVKAMAELCGAYWLIDAIASWQPECLKDPMLRHIQFWTLVRCPDGGWNLCVERDTGDRGSCQRIELSDFPLDQIKLIAAAGGPDGAMVLMLPTEY